MMPVLGIAMLSLLITAFFVFIAWAEGLRAAAFVFLFTAFIMGWVLLAVSFLEG